MGSTKFDIDKFMRKNDFVLWQIKMRAILVQQGCLLVLGGESSLPSNLSDQKKVELWEKVYNTIILGLGDKVLKEISKEMIALVFG